MESLSTVEEWLPSNTFTTSIPKLTQNLRSEIVNACASQCALSVCIIQ